ncbi:hypothetical protein Q5H93_18715 [Hymenobacter sp. ASUV-10]|uniref:Uncharacterized protein n=1 Tax=Hymenobacter aranciens TaxID=3063996 RepID=A0ABT9BEU1_9BACT|nr:hypothetical protein [Hymenobacter sp. ASUV-10]MDO7876785.1 hypothetical protein [Hymenobacter sp. ASUV-10]
MTADQRLDQLEPLVAQTLAVADRHTAQLNQANNQLTQVTGQLNQIVNQLNQVASLGSQQSDNTGFLLQELAEVKQEVGEIKQAVSVLIEGQGALTSEVTMMSARLSTLETTVMVTNMKVTNLDGKMDRMIELLSGSK